MPLKLTAPVSQDFVLTRSDEVLGTEGDPTRVSIRQAAQGEYERRQQMFSEWVRAYDPATGQDQVVQRLNIEMLKRLEVFLTIADCNIEAENEKPLFRFKGGNLSMSELEFDRAWAKLPLVIATEIHEKVLEVNPTWDAAGEAM